LTQTERQSCFTVSLPCIAANRPTSLISFDLHYRKCLPQNVVRRCTVVVPPTFEVEPPESVLAERGQTLVLNCQANGEPAPVVTWHRQSIHNPISNRDRVSALSNNSLRYVLQLFGFTHSDSKIFVIKLIDVTNFYKN